MSKRKLSVPIAEAPAYTHTSADLAAMAKMKERRKARGPLAEIKVEQKGKGVEVAPDHPDLAVGGTILANAVGTVSGPFAEQLLARVVTDTRRPDGTIDVTAVNAALAVIQGVQPRDEVEAPLLSQMIQVNRAMSKASAMFHAADMLPQWTATELAMNRLARTYALQMDTLKRYRSTGEQRVTVQHVTVSEGGQAVVGEVHHNAAPGDRAPALEDSSGVLIDAVSTVQRGRGDR